MHPVCHRILCTEPGHHPMYALIRRFPDRRKHDHVEPRLRQQLHCLHPGVAVSHYARRRVANWMRARHVQPRCFGCVHQVPARNLLCSCAGVIWLHVHDLPQGFVRGGRWHDRVHPMRGWILWNADRPGRVRWKLPGVRDGNILLVCSFGSMRTVWSGTVEQPDCAKVHERVPPVSRRNLLDCIHHCAGGPVHQVSCRILLWADGRAKQRNVPGVRPGHVFYRRGHHHGRAVHKVPARHVQYTFRTELPAGLRRMHSWNIFTGGRRQLTRDVFQLWDRQLVHCRRIHQLREMPQGDVFGPGRAIVQWNMHGLPCRYALFMSDALNNVHDLAHPWLKKNKTQARGRIRWVPTALATAWHVPLERTRPRRVPSIRQRAVRAAREHTTDKLERRAKKCA